MTLAKVTTWKTIKFGTKIYTNNPKEIYISIQENQCEYYINGNKLPGTVYLEGEDYLEGTEYFVEVVEEVKIKPEIITGSTDSIAKFKVGSTYTAANHQSFQIKILKRTAKTVWYENIINDRLGDFCCQGKKRVQVRLGREIVIDGLHQYNAA
ncbi:MAG: hypothetical protein ACKPJF_18405 [Dolichospermum sp.]